MLRVIRRSDYHHGDISDLLVLAYELRQRGRFRATSQHGLDVGVFLTRGETLQHGDCLFTECGKVIKVVAEEENVITAVTEDWLTFAKACYHLGNRHVPLEIGDRWLRFQPDHVLETMISLLGLTCHHHLAMFNPESGAYQGSGHSHGKHHHSTKEHDHG